MLPELNADENNSQDGEDHEEGDDLSVIPWVLGSTPLQGQQQAHNRWDEGEGAVKIELLDAGLPSEICHSSSLGTLEEDDDDGNSDCSDGEVNIETPPPGSSISEDTTEEGASNRGNSVHGSNEAGVHGTLRQGDRVCNDDQGSREDTRGTDTCDGTTKNQSGRVRGNTADQAAQFEDTDGDEVDPFDREVGVELSEEELE